MSRGGKRKGGDVDLADTPETKGGNKGIPIRRHVSVVRWVSQREGEYPSIWTKTEACVQRIRAGMKSWNRWGKLQADDRQSMGRSSRIE